MKLGIASPKKFVLLNTSLVIGLFLVFSLLIRFGAVKETTWLDTIATPIALAVGLVFTLNVTIILATRKKK